MYCLHLTEVPVESYFQLNFETIYFYIFLPMYVCLFYTVVIGSYFAFSTSGYVLGTVTLLKSSMRSC